MFKLVLIVAGKGFFMPLSSLQFVKSNKKDVIEDEMIYKKSLQDFIDQVLRFYDILRDFMYTVETLNDSQTLTYLHSCISNRAHDLAVPDQPMYLDSYIADTPLLGGMSPKLGDNYLKTIVLLLYTIILCSK